MNTELGRAKIYLKAQDLGKMLKLNDIENLAITNVNIKDSKDVEIEIVTPLSNKTNNRVKLIKRDRVYHIGVDYRKYTNKISIVIFEENNKKYNIIALKFAKDIEAALKELSYYLNKSIFYINKRGFGITIYEKLIQQGIKKESIIINDLNNLNLTRLDIFSKLIDIKPSCELEDKYIQIMNEVYRLGEEVVLNGKIKFINNNPSGFLEVLTMFLMNL
ncbi:MAG: hypothetical protein RSA91_01005 [Bacilli bacterium]